MAHTHDLILHIILSYSWIEGGGVGGACVGSRRTACLSLLTQLSSGAAYKTANSYRFNPFERHTAKNYRSTKWTKLTLKLMSPCAKFNKFQLTFSYRITVVYIYSDMKILQDQRHQGSKKKRTRKTRKWCHICHFTIYFEWVISLFKKRSFITEI